MHAMVIAGTYEWYKALFNAVLYGHGDHVLLEQV